MLEIRNLSIEFRRRHGWDRVIDNVSVTLDRGEVLCLVGESGAGKSTIGNAVIGLLDAQARVASGQILFEGRDLLTTTASEMRDLRGCHLSMIFQNPMTALNPVRSIGAQLVETLKQRLGLKTNEARARALSWLNRVGIPNAQERMAQFPHQFSGGQLQRIVIAMALCPEPEIVIADEPTTALDVSVQAQILDLLRQLVRETGVGIIFVTHNMGVVAEIADKVAVLRHGILVEAGPVAQVLHAPRKDYTKLLVSSVPPTDRRLRRLPVLGKDGALDMQEEEPGRPLGTEDPILRVKDLQVTYRLGRNLFQKPETLRALTDVSFDITRGTCLGLVGESGSGKSTCARAIVGLTPVDQGQILFEGTDLNGMPERRRMPLRHEIQMIFQDPYSSINRRLNVRDIIAEPLRFYGITRNATETDDRVAMLLKDVGLSADVMRRYPHQFSGGQRQRIAIARTLASRPKLIICDEPTSALDVSVQAQIINLIKDLQDEHGLTLLFISHDLPLVRQICDDIVVLKNGLIVEHAPTVEVFETPQETYTQELLRLVPTLHPKTQIPQRKDPEYAD
ncbi:ABC transporter ATP-binding protein [Sulfitobacter porphyrae]|uniref:ABC transporter ATP-binding protein n=1 Tax=Sulfitobacter porphyrae TaxID=1246864 RepID=A0ABW2B8V3_9RHOB|nr:ABC transporter ATP-binding protein [Sulfitobacter porphyrae]